MLQQEIAAINESEKPSDSIKKTVLLRSLPTEYQSIVFALKAAGLSKITFDDMVQRPKETETGLKGLDLSQGENMARAARRRHDSARNAQSSQGRPQRGQSDKKEVECFHCHKKSHFKKECWLLI